MNKIVINIFVDAFGREIFKRYGFNKTILPFNKRIETVFGFSSACEPSIFSGRYPSEHQHFSSYFYDKKKSPFNSLSLLYKLSPGALKSFLDHGGVRHYMSKLFAYAKGYTGYFQLYHMPLDRLKYFDYLEKRDYFVPGGIIRTNTLMDELKYENIPFHISNWRKNEEENIKQALKQISEKKIKYLYVYLPKLDGLLHYYGTHHSEISKKIKWLESVVKKIYVKANAHYKDVSLSLFSDHGMTDVYYPSDLMLRIERLPLKYGSDYVAVYDSTVARFWFFNPQAKQIISSYLNNCKEGDILSDVDLKGFNTFFPNRKFGELFFLLYPHHLLVPSYFNKRMVRGMHGYHPDHKDSHALLLSNKPIPPEIKSIVDLRMLNERWLELKSSDFYTGEFSASAQKFSIGNLANQGNARKHK